MFDTFSSHNNLYYIAWNNLHYKFALKVIIYIIISSKKAVCKKILVLLLINKNMFIDQLLSKYVSILINMKPKLDNILHLKTFT